jgi:hypothetical protein
MGKPEIARPPLPVTLFGVNMHAKVSDKCCTGTSKCRHVKPKCPKLKPKCPLFLGHFVLLSFVFNNLLGSFVNFFSSAPLPYCKLDTALSFEFPVSSFAFALSSFEFRVPKAHSGPASCEFFLRPWGKSTWRGRGRARSGRPGACEPTGLRHSEQKTHLRPAKRAIVMPLSYGLPAQR